eukprot:TRINITY_DN667_c0_g2_i1.p1 TRINITY_DN667_c0_g2~~TRINITY_DN667_c0_g2_i1.p1  ORF type:complete len:609 (-),score=123.11 TRINITY_DN667_c0_g2_i1:693-2519(-)
MADKHGMDVEEGEVLVASNGHGTDKQKLDKVSKEKSKNEVVAEDARNADKNRKTKEEGDLKTGEKKREESRSAEKKSKREEEKRKKKERSRSRDRRKKSSERSPDRKKDQKHRDRKSPRRRSRSRSNSRHDKRSRRDFREDNRGERRRRSRSRSNSASRSKRKNSESKERNLRDSQKDREREREKKKRSIDYLKERGAKTAQHQKGKPADVPKEVSLNPEEKKKNEEVLTKMKSMRDEEDTEKILEERRRKRQELMENLMKTNVTNAGENANVVEGASDAVMTDEKTKNEEVRASADQAAPAITKPVEPKENRKDGESSDSAPGSPKEVHHLDPKRVEYLKLIEKLREQRKEEDGKLDEEKDEAAEPAEEGKAKNARPGRKEFDMFTDSPTEMDEETFSGAAVIKSALEWDDDEGYYKIKIGEVINNQYKIVSKLGKGVYGNVAKALDVKTGREFALKVIRSQEIFLRSGERERDFLQKLNDQDKNDKWHIVRMLNSFDYRRHLWLVFELMEMDLRETIKTYGKKIGLSIEGVRSYAKQILIALTFLKKNKLIHADLKPDNILVTNNKKTCKICDLGSAFPIEENYITEELVSRFYRAPEIILGKVFI